MQHHPDGRQPYWTPAPQGSQAPRPKYNHAIAARAFLIVGAISAAYAAASGAAAWLSDDPRGAFTAWSVVAFIAGLIGVGLAGFNSWARHVFIILGSLAAVVALTSHSPAQPVEWNQAIPLAVSVVAYHVGLALLPARPISHRSARQM